METSTKSTGKGYFRLKQINPVIKYLTLSDIMVISGFGLVAPIFAVFITDSIAGGSLEVVGIATAIYLIAKSLGQIPTATIIDRIKGEIDDFWTLFIGTMLYSLVPIAYIFISTPTQLYIVQFIYGLATAITLPSWYALFTRHIDKQHEGVEWGVYQTMVDIGSAATASIGGFIAVKFGFNNLFILVSIISLIGGMFILLVKKTLEKSDGKQKRRKKA